MEQGEAPPTALDYIGHAQSKRTDEPEFDRDYARYNPLMSLVARADLYTVLPVSFAYSKIYQAAQIAGSHGLNMAATLLLHFLEGSGEAYSRLPVDDMIDELPLLRKDILDIIGYNLGENFPPRDDPGHSLGRQKAHESDTHAVYSYAGDWREVGIGKNAESTVYDFDDNTLDLDPSRLIKLLYGQPPSDDIPQEQYDWYLAVGNFNYYPRITVVVDKSTGDAEVGLEIEVRDNYDWHADAGPLDSIMAKLEEAGYGKHFPVSGLSSAIIGRFNLNDKTIRKEEEYYQLTITEWGEDE